MTTASAMIANDASASPVTPSGGTTPNVRRVDRISPPLPARRWGTRWLLAAIVGGRGGARRCGPAVAAAVLAALLATAGRSQASDAIAVHDVTATDAVRKLARTAGGDVEGQLDVFLSQITHRLKERLDGGGLMLVVRGPDMKSWIVEQGAMGNLELDLGRSIHIVRCEIDSFVVQDASRTLRNPAVPWEVVEKSRVLDAVGSVVVLRSDAPERLFSVRVGSVDSDKRERKRSPHGHEEDLPANMFDTLTSKVADDFARQAAEEILGRLAAPLVLSCSGVGFLIDPRSKRLHSGQVWDVVRSETVDGRVVKRVFDRVKIEEVHATYAMARPVQREQPAGDGGGRIQPGDTLVGGRDLVGVTTTQLYKCPDAIDDGACWGVAVGERKRVPMLVVPSPWNDPVAQRFAAAVRGAISSVPGSLAKVRIVDPDAILFAIDNLGRAPKQGAAEENLIAGVSPEQLCRELGGAAFVFVEKPTTATEMDRVMTNGQEFELRRADASSSWRLFEATKGTQIDAGTADEFRRFRIDPGPDTMVDRVERALAEQIAGQIVAGVCKQQGRIEVPPKLRKVEMTVRPQIALPKRGGDGEVVMRHFSVQANLFVDGMFVGQTPWEGGLILGLRRLRFEGQGIEPLEIFQRVEDPPRGQRAGSINPFLTGTFQVDPANPGNPLLPERAFEAAGQLRPERRPVVVVGGGASRVWDPSAGLD